MTKDQILQGYLNLAYYGDLAYGVEAAAQHYFSIPAKKLNLPQAALLAGLVQNPSRTDPVHYPERAQARRDVVLDRMHTLGIITDKQLKAAKAIPVAKMLKLQEPGEQLRRLAASRTSATTSWRTSRQPCPTPGQDRPRAHQEHHPGRPDHPDHPRPRRSRTWPRKDADQAGARSATPDGASARAASDRRSRAPARSWPWCQNTTYPTGKRQPDARA